MKEVTLPPMFQSRRATGFDERGDGTDTGLAMTLAECTRWDGSLLAQNIQGIPRKGQTEVGCNGWRLSTRPKSFTR